MSFPKIVQEAFHQAKAVRQRAYAPYSKFLVGAAVKVQGQDHIISGCNVENASYGATICAERSAILSAVAQGFTRFDFLVLVTGTPNGDMPCGQCLQVMAEFFEGETPVYICNDESILRSVSFRELLPNQFDKSSL
jgi:cytidine deaminase